MKKETAVNPGFYKNEVEANKTMCIVSGFTAIATFLVLLCYAFKLFWLNNYTQVYIALPILIIFLILPLFYRKTRFVEKPGFKYFLLLQILIVVGILNILLPKHAVLGYGFVIILASHYYSPRLTRIIFLSTILMLLLCLYGGMLVGEYDPYLLTDGKIMFDAEGNTYLYQPESPSERLAFLAELAAAGTNRYLQVFIYYFVSRTLILTLIFLAAIRLSRRTQRLMVSEVSTQAEKSRIDTELGVAQEVQSTMLPLSFFQSKNIEILAQLRPAREVGGDFYDYATLDEDHVAILIGDVSGKGVPAAMFMMKTITSFRACYDANSTPKKIMERVNKLIYQGNEEAGLFVTCFLAIVNIKTGEISFANAGHTPPIIGRGGKYAPLPCAHGFLMGAMPELMLRDEKTKLRPGDSILIYTDGITEARNTTGGLYGESRLLKFLNNTKVSSSIEMSHELEDDIMEFAGGAEQSDDITYLMLTFQGKMNYFMQRSFPAVLESINDIEAMLRDAGAKASCSERTISNFIICVDEIFSNIVKYSGSAPSDRIYFRCIYTPENNRVSVTIVDHGVPFDPREAKSVRVDERDLDAPVGGLGWLMVRRLMDELAYHRVNGKNVVSITAKAR